MSISVRVLVPAVAVAMSVIVGAAAVPSSSLSEIQLELGDLLFADERYGEAISVYQRAKDGAEPEQLLRASAGLLKSLLLSAEFNLAYDEAVFLESLDIGELPELRVLVADGFWAYGLFDEADAVYDEVLMQAPSNARARHGLSRGLAALNRHEEALVEIQAAIVASPVDPVLHHTHGEILKGLRRYEAAAEAFERYLDVLPNIRETRQTAWVRSEVRFLRSFGGRVPFEMPREGVVHTLPFRLVNDKIVVRGRVNGSDPVDLVVDSGAEQMVLSQELAESAGVLAITQTISAGVGEVGMRGLDFGRVDSLEIGSFKVRNIPTIIKNPPLALIGMPSPRVSDSLSPLAFGLSVVIDYRNSSLILAEHLPDEVADVELPMRVQRLAVVRGVVNDKHPKSFVVDTGGEVISISMGTAAAIRMVPKRHIPLRVFGTSGWDQDAFLLPGVHLAFRDIKYDNLPAVVLNLHRPSVLMGFHIGGIIGYDFLRNYRVAMDLDRSVLRLTRN
jgi:predicted aspartyl protease/Flp pilus assembly protein TadD